MDCPAVRHLLSEHVLGTLDAEARGLVDRHVAWCAGCRKEAAHLADGAAEWAMAMGGPEPPLELEDRVVEAVRAAGRKPRRARPRAALAAAALAAVLAMGSVAWAVTLAGRLDELEGQAAAARSAARSAVGRFEEVVREIGGRDRVRSADLSGTGGAEGRALVYDGDQDWVLVVATGLPEGRGPYQAYLTALEGRVGVGRLAPQAPGELATARIFPGAVSPFRGVLVIDADGASVLQGSLGSSPG